MNDQPIFQSVFGESWEKLPAVMHKHYANRPNSGDLVTVEGTMNVRRNWLAVLMSPFMRFTNTLVPWSGNNIPVTVHFRSEQNTSCYCFDRVFNFPSKKPYHFRSKMEPVGGNELIEWIGFGMGWHNRYVWDGRRAQMKHRGYALKIFGRTFHMPLEWLLGKTTAWEEAIDDNRFRMFMSIAHPLWGEVYVYEGEFSVTGIVRK